MAIVVSEALSTPAVPDVLDALDKAEFVQAVRVFNQAVKQFYSLTQMGLTGAKNPKLLPMMDAGQAVDEFLKDLFPDDYNPDETDDEQDPLAALMQMLFALEKDVEK